jgi:hypothetical protein
VKMWRLLKSLLIPPKPIPLGPTRVIDFSTPRRGHWIKFEGGDNFDAQFVVCGSVTKGDDVLVLMQSGRIGRYTLFSVLRDFRGGAEWRVRGVAIGYWPLDLLRQKSVPSTPRAIKGLLGDGSRRVQPNLGQSSPLPDGFTKSSSEFWAVLGCNETHCAGANSCRTTSNM